MLTRDRPVPSCTVRGYDGSRFFLICGAATPRLSSRVRSIVDVASVGSQVTLHTEASSLAASQISYPTPPNDCDTPPPRPTPPALTTASTVTRDAHTWLRP